MWHEARRQERKIRGMLVDYRKRAERRRDFYEKIKADPTQFLQIHGRQCKIHLDPAIAAAADSAVMMPWQNQADNLIDRFDVRAHLDHIPPIKKEDPPELTQEDRQLNYERYRIIAQNAYLSISEEKFLKQLYLEEQFGYTDSKGKKETKGTGAMIGFNYEDGTAIPGPTQLESPEENSDDDNSDSDLDVDLAINVSKIDSAQAHEMNKHGQHFGMSGNDFYSFLTNDLEEAESYKLAKEEEHEKALFSGRKSRRERRAHREKRLANRKISPPSYAAKEFLTNQTLRDDSKSPSRSPSPDPGKITYITSFGDDEEPPAKTYADKVRCGKPKKKENSSERQIYIERKDNQINNKSLFYNRKRRSTSKSRQIMAGNRSRRSRSRERKPSRSRSNSRSRLNRLRRSFSRDRALNHFPRYKRRQSRSRSRSKIVRNRRSRSRSRPKRISPRQSRSGSRSNRREDTRAQSRSRKSRSGSRRRSPSFHRRSPSSSSLSSSSSSGDSNINKPHSSTSDSSKSKSKSKTPEPPSPPKIVPRYYGRKRSDQSSSKSSSSDDEDNQESDSRPVNLGSSESKFGSGNNSGTVSKKSSTSTIIERLKRRRQAAINKQYIKDKIAEVQKLEREKQEQQTREDELREMAIKLRRRQREKRHAYDRSSSSDSEKSGTSRNRESRSPRSRDRDSSRSDRERKGRERTSRSRERSRRTVSKERHRERRSRSRSRRRDRERDREGKRDREDGPKEVKKLVDY